MKIIDWMTKNPVAANILLLMILFGGFLTAGNLEQEVFPTVDLDMVFVQVVYRGAGPSEVAESLCVPLEEALNDVDGIEEMLCQAKESVASLSLTLEDGTDVDELLQEVRNQVGRIVDFPTDIETPSVTKGVRQRRVLSLALSGTVDEEVLYRLGKRIKDELSTIEAISRVTTSGLYNREMSIEVKPGVLRSHNITLTELANIVQAASLDLPAGKIQTQEKQWLLRSLSKRSTAEDFSKIVVQSKPSGGKVLLGDLAVIEERAKEVEDFVLLDGKPSVFFELYQKKGFTPKEALEQSEVYLEKAKLDLPQGVDLVIWEDRSEIFSQRFELLMKNAVIGLCLVFIVLALFLELHLAFWVMLGIPISFAGSLILLPLGDVSINMISMMAFILVLGIVVDDAIVVGEKVFQLMEKGAGRLEAAIEGTKAMAPAVIFAIATTCMAFAPLLFIEGVMGRFMYSVPVIIISVLVLSLVEALVILPAHLAQMAKPFKARPLIALERLRHRCDDALSRFIQGPYAKTLSWALKNQGLSLSLAVVSLMITASLVAGGILAMQFFPSIEADEVQLTLELPAGYSGKKAETILRRIEQRGKDLIAKEDQKAGNGIESLEHSYIEFNSQSSEGSSTARVKFRLLDADLRNVEVFQLGRNWRRAIGDLPEIKNMSVRSRGMHFGDDISLALTHTDNETLSEAIEATKAYISGFTGVSDIDDSEKEGKQEVRFVLRPEARSLGINPREFAQAIRAGFNGVKVGNLLKDKSMIEIMVRYPAEVRNNPEYLERLRIKTAGGGEIALGDAADIEMAVEPTSIRREDRERVVVVTAKILDSVSNPDAITEDITEKLIPQIKAQFPGLKIQKTGRDEDRAKSMRGLLVGFGAAQIFIYALLAIFFRSYFQPLLVMVAIPFGITGAAIGHLILGYPLSFLSLFGLVGLTGVVVNDSLILLDAINKHPHQETDLFKAVLEASQSRVRPILMTTVTTFFGLMPLLLETSRQAKFLVPMAISLGVGIVFATVITLVLIPLFYIMQQRLILERWSFFMPGKNKGVDGTVSEEALTPKEADDSSVQTDHLK